MSTPSRSSQPNESWRPRTWGFVIGSLTASLATLVGVWADVEPDTVLSRAAVGGMLVGGITFLTAGFARAAQPPQPSDY